MGRRTEAGELTNRVRELRRAEGLSQGELARQVGITRQAISAIESGQYMPNTLVALRVARALGCSVEDLFIPGDMPRNLRARMAAGDDRSQGGIGRQLRRVLLARVGDEVIASPLSETQGFAAADGIVDATENGDRELSVDLLVDPGLPERTAVVLGCDPSLGILAGHIRRGSNDLRVLWRNAGSLEALWALRRGEAHVAGTHLWDPATGESNLPAIRAELVGMSVLVLALAEWQQGILVQSGNPGGIRGVLDLARSDVSIVNRGPGSGSRVLFDHHLEQAGLRSAWIAGYDRLRGSHAEVAQAIRDGIADAGPGILAVARLYGLEFIPLQQERYDLVIPTRFLEHPAVIALLNTLTGSIYRRELDSLGGYDSSIAGTTIAELTA